ncbi:hypothetical protein acsn021_07840 [Anaerocolumna cellulosilytica]|uniref:Uncharacterized protein n=1 Tax=Anaerocolumna cellulosilytica TaxID=433286 RepID=A0A6S6R0U4_9FIRM|nr:AraC family transcriptional regulator [Anaerocolumna cellulosilytica]MBB5197642.1 AraC family transcriptional regulator of arabinose operon [Anaerocolumna cellulosilytica]BCJ93215.1 hypothetical protein acsn021_07840 [Anaerocolumna cellulosilytica]
MITVTNCGHDSRHKTGFRIIRKTGVPNYILLLVKTDALFEIKGKMIVTEPNMAILFDKNTYTHYGSNMGFYNDDWIHFDFKDEPCLLDTLNIPFNQPVYLPFISHLSAYVRQLVQESNTPSKHKDAIKDTLMRTLLFSLDSQIALNRNASGDQKYITKMNQLRNEIHNTPQKKWSAQSMADYMNLSISYFQHLYKHFFKISCIQEVIQARILRAKFYLKTTDMSIRVIAELCGYDNELHFMRQFKKFEGITPSQYRSYSR